jgi:NodT family efflux transporter outer membrane factor (OMF) lipoprotein
MSEARQFLLVVLLGLLPGCTVGPFYHPPAVKAAAQWSSPLAGGETIQPAANVAWWKNFNDPELDALIERAVQSNLDLKIATARVREARAQYGVTSGDLWPSMGSSGSYQRQLQSKHQPILGALPLPASVPFENDIYQAGFDASWEIDVFGGTRRAVEAARAETAAAEYGWRATLVSLLGEVARYYVEARGFQQRLAIAHQNIDAQQAIVTLTRSLFKGGLTSELDVQEAAALLATTEAQVPSLETSFKEAAHRLGVLLGQPPGALLAELSREAPIPDAPPGVPVGLPSQLLRRRPDIQQAERELAGANARIGIAVADLYPKFSLTGDVGLQSVSTSDWFSSGSRFWSAGPTVQWKIFDAGRIRASIKVQNAREEQALARYEQTVLASFEDVENALTAYAREQTRRQSLADAVQANRQALEMAGQLYRSGVADFLRVLESQRSLYESQDALAQSDRTVILNLIKLYKALGGGWENLAGKSIGVRSVSAPFCKPANLMT